MSATTTTAATQAERAGLEEQRPFQLVKYYSVTSLVIILFFALVISSTVSRRAGDIVLQNQEQFALLLAENLNHQVMTRFVLPVIQQYSRLRLSEPEQYQLLDAVVTNTLHSFAVRKVNIQDLNGNIVYSTQREYLNRVGELGKPFQAAVAGGHYSVLEPRQGWFDLWSGGDKVLRMFIPLRDERRRTSELGPPRAVFEISLDVSQDFHQVWINQILIVATLLGMMAILFVILRSIVIRGQRVMDRRAQEQSRLEEKLNQAERLASLGRMVAGVAHEIRNPLGIVRSTAELLGGRVDPASKPLTRVIVEESTRLNQIVTEFLDFARPQIPRLRPMFLEDLLTRTLRMLEPQVKSLGVEVETRLSPRPTPVMGDPEQLYRAILNIINNALQAMEDSPGRLVVSTHPPGNDHPGMVTMAVTDNGPGIDPDIVSNIFDPFFTTKEQGTGLGLSIVRSIIDSHQGELELQPAPQGGTRVEVRLPFTDQVPPESLGD